MATQSRPRGKAKDRMPTGSAAESAGSVPAQLPTTPKQVYDPEEWFPRLGVPTGMSDMERAQRTGEAERRKEVAELAADFARLIVSAAGGFPVVDGDREFAIRMCVAQARAFYDEVYRPTSKPGQGRRTGKGEKAKSSGAEEMGVGDDYAEFFDERYDDGEE